MASYKDMYYKLFVSTSRIIDEMKESLLSAEDYYMTSFDPTKPEVLSESPIRQKIVLDNAVTGKNLRTLRTRYSMSLEQLAAVMGISPQFVRLIERGQRGISLNRICLVANYFDVSIDSLLAPDPHPIVETYDFPTPL